MAQAKALRALPQVPALYASYGLSQASLTAVDVLVLVFAAKALYAPERHIGFLDATGTIAYTIACVAFGLLWRNQASRLLIALCFLIVSIPVFLLSSAGALWMVYALTILFGALMVLPSAGIANCLASLSPRSELPEVYGKMGASGSLGGALGLVLAMVWLATASRFDEPQMGTRILFVVMGVMAVVSAAGVWHATAGYLAGPQRPAPLQPGGAAALPRRRWWPVLGPQRRPQVATTLPARQLREDTFGKFLFLNALLYVGVGMSFSGALLFIFGVGASDSVILMMVLIFRIAASLVSGPTGKHLNEVMPLRFQQIAGMGRLLTAVLLALLFLIPAGPWSLIALVPLVAALGGSSGVMGVTGPAAASMMVPASRRTAAFLMFVAVSNGGAGAGTWMAALAAPSLGFSAVMGMSVLVLVGVLLLQHRL